MTDWINRYKEWKKARDAKRKEPETPIEHIVSWFKTMFGAVFFIMIVNGLFFGSFVVPTGSMENTVATGDFVNRKGTVILKIPLPRHVVLCDHDMRADGEEFRVDFVVVIKVGLPGEVVICSPQVNARVNNLVEMQNLIKALRF